MFQRYSIPDRKSFVKFPRGATPESHRFIGHLFATDGRNVFSTRGMLKDVDARTFRVIEESSETRRDGMFVSGYAATSEKAIYVDQLTAPRVFRPKALDDLHVLAPHFATDGVVVYYDGVRVAGADAETFRPLRAGYSVDRSFCYYRSVRIDQADPRSLRILGHEDEDSRVSYDETAIYYCDRPVVVLSASTPELRRVENGYVIGVFDGKRMWTMSDLETVYRDVTARRRKSVVFDNVCSEFRFDDAMFTGVEDDFSMFLMLCSHKTVQELETFTRGKRGEKAVVRSIERLNNVLPVRLAIISAETINITSDGVAAYRQYGGVVDVISSFVAALKQ